MKELLRNILKILFIYLLFVTVAGVVKVEALLQYISPDLLKMARISSYTSLLMSSLMAVAYFIAMVFFAYFAFSLFGKTLSNAVYTKAVTYFMIFYAFNEVAKLFVLLLILGHNNLHIINSLDSLDYFLQTVNLEKWTYIIDTVCFVFSVICYNFALIKKGKMKMVDCLFVTLFFVFIFAVSHKNLFVIFSKSL